MLGLVADTVTTISTSMGKSAASIQPSSESVIVMLTDRLTMLERDYAALENQSELLVQKAYQQGLEEGRKTGIAEGAEGAIQDHVAQLTMLKNGLTAMQSTWQQKVTSLEPLALDIAQAVLQQIFGETSLQAALVIRSIKHHLQTVMAESVTGVEVSALDFPDQSQLQNAFPDFGKNAEFTIAAQQYLPHGACYLRLTLGRMDISVPRQLKQVGEALDEMVRVAIHSEKHN